MSVFHAGEQALQQRAGVRERLEAVGPVVVRDHMPDQHRVWFGSLPTLLLAILDDQGQPWATMLQGPAGFVSSPDPHTLSVRALPGASDPVAPWLVDGAAIGVLGLEPHTRRRNRANGTVRALRSDGFDVQVLQSFGNCPKYIQARHPLPQPASEPLPAQWLGPQLDSRAIALLGRADTVFIASASSARPGDRRADGVDMSHRGGPPGFIRVSASRPDVRLTVPDYVGNFYFNTLGNLQVWPRAGLLVPDHDDGSLLHLAASACIEFDGPDLQSFAGAQRLLHLDVTAGCWRPGALPLRWSAPDAAPQFATLAGTRAPGTNAAPQ